MPFYSRPSLVLFLSFFFLCIVCRLQIMNLLLALHLTDSQEKSIEKKPRSQIKIYKFLVRLCICSSYVFESRSIPDTYVTANYFIMIFILNCVNCQTFANKLICFFFCLEQIRKNSIFPKDEVLERGHKNLKKYPTEFWCYYSSNQITKNKISIWRS